MDGELSSSAASRRGEDGRTPYAIVGDRHIVIQEYATILQQAANGIVSNEANRALDTTSHMRMVGYTLVTPLALSRFG